MHKNTIFRTIIAFALIFAAFSQVQAERIRVTLEANLQLSIVRNEWDSKRRLLADGQRMAMGMLGGTLTSAQTGRMIVTAGSQPYVSKSGTYDIYEMLSVYGHAQIHGKAGTGFLVDEVFGYTGMEGDSRIYKWSGPITAFDFLRRPARPKRKRVDAKLAATHLMTGHFFVCKKKLQKLVFVT